MVLLLQLTVHEGKVLWVAYMQAHKGKISVFQGMS